MMISHMTVIQWMRKSKDRMSIWFCNMVMVSLKRSSWNYLMTSCPIPVIISNHYVQDLKETVRSYHMKVQHLTEFLLMNLSKAEISEVQWKMMLLNLIPYLKMENLGMKALSIDIKKQVCCACVKSQNSKIQMSVNFILL